MQNDSNKRFDIKQRAIKRAVGNQHNNTKRAAADPKRHQILKRAHINSTTELTFGDTPLQLRELAYEFRLDLEKVLQYFRKISIVHPGSLKLKINFDWSHFRDHFDLTDEGSRKSSLQ